MRTIKFLVFSVLVIIIGNPLFAQSIPETHIDGVTLGSPSVTYKCPGNVISTSTNTQPTYVLGNGQVKFIGGESVVLKDGFTASSFTGSGYFNAYIQTPDFEVVFIEPDQSYPTVGRYEKLELGLRLPADVTSDIDYFLNTTGATSINPYDPDQINVEAIFTKGNASYKTYGFYYKEFKRDAAYLTPDSSDTDTCFWDRIETDYEWRIRFAPPQNGTWNCDIKVYLSGNSTASYSVNNIQFDVVESGKSGFMTVAPDHRHFMTSNGEAFIPIGQNIAWCDPKFMADWLNYNGGWNGITNSNFINRIHGTGFLDMHDFINSLADNNGNFVRIVSNENCYLFEWEELGVYGSNRDGTDFLRQKRSWELDKIFETAEERDIKLLFCLEYHGQWEYFGTYGSNYSSNPYLTLAPGSDPPEFFDNQFMMQAYEKKLRYFLARWGYSSGLGVLQYFSELDNWSYDSDETFADKNLNISLASDIASWHSTIGAYVKSNTPRPILLTSGFGGTKNRLMMSTTPTRPIGSFNYSPYVDLVIHNRYGHDRGENWEMQKEAQDYLSTFIKPFLYTETGIAISSGDTDGDGVRDDADPWDTESCDDVMFHNSIWAGMTSGAAGTNLNWWSWDDNARRSNYQAMSTFVDQIDFLSYNFTENRRWPNNTAWIPSCQNSITLDPDVWVESYTVGAKDPNDNNRVNRLFGWAHNLTHYWWNLTSYTSCMDRWMTEPLHAPCDDDVNNTALFLNTSNNIMEVHGLKIYANYDIEWFKTNGSGGLLQTGTDYTNIFGTAEYHLPASPLWNSTWDYAFKINRAGSSFRETDTHYTLMETDTIYCGDDTIRVEDPGDPGSTYSWNFGNGMGSSSATPTVVYSSPGSYTVTLIITDSLGTNDTLVQTIVKLECDTTEERSLTNSDPTGTDVVNNLTVRKDLTKYLEVYPNPNNGEFIVSISSPVEANPSLTIIDVFGRHLFNMKVNISEGLTIIPISVTEFASGTYFIKVDGFDEPIKMIISK